MKTIIEIPDGVLIKFLELTGGSENLDAAVLDLMCKSIDAAEDTKAVPVGIDESENLTLAECMVAYLRANPRQHFSVLELFKACGETPIGMSESERNDILVQFFRELQSIPYTVIQAPGDSFKDKYRFN